MISEYAWKQVWFALVLAMMFSGAIYWAEQFPEWGGIVGFFAFMACLVGMGRFTK